MVAFHGSHVVVTGGTGALGSAVVGALRAAGAVCHVTNMEAAVRRFYAGLPPLWASIHLAGGFAMSPVGETSAVAFADQFQMNALSAFLCSAAAIRAIRTRAEAGPGGAKGGRV